MHLRSGSSLADLAREINPVVRGWINYYGRFYPSALVPSLKGIDHYLMRWAMQKYKRLRRRRSRAWQGLEKTARLYPGLFAHWKLLRPRTTG
ncbi:group II intron maturase-specific domain-containing protein [Streptomyces sp. NPDC052042]|uniref:group II intron maturase-specific domain-containing protein n=1 Tax=Streptomyces sp. NPDC052042 TaxID=3365683 RepID=UPI0037CF26F5